MAGLSIILMAVFFGVSAVSSDAALDLQSPTFTIPYGTFQVRIYATPDSNKFYYAPVCAFVPNSTDVKFFGNHSLRNFITFPVQFWDAKYQDYISARVSEELRKNITRSNLKLIPFHSVRFDSTDTTNDFIIENKWTSVVHQPASIRIRIHCSTNDDCTAKKEALNDDHEQRHILDHIEITFALKKPMHTRKKLVLSTTAIKRSHLFRLIEQRLSDSVEVCMQETVLRRMVRETLDNIVEDQLTQDEFISEDQIQISINRVIHLMKTRSTSTASFQENDWNRTFWPEAMDRPDEKMKNVNTLLGNGKGWVRAFLKPGSSVKALQGKNFAQEPQSHIDWSVITSQLEGTEDIIQWNGDAFVMKPLTLLCLNLIGLRETVLGNVNVLASVRYGNWNSGVNILSTPYMSEYMQPVEEIRERLQSTERELRGIEESISNSTPIGTIIAYHSSYILPLCWLYCNGSEFNSSLYPVLAGILHPGLYTPNLNGRVPVGVGANYSLAVGGTGGTATHALTLDEMPSHNHEIRITNRNVYSSATLYPFTGYMTSHRDSDGYKMETESKGIGQAHNNLQPFLTTSYIIRAC